MSNRRSPSLPVFGLFLIIIAVSLMLLLGLLGGFHAAFDTLSHFRSHLAAAMGAIALVMLTTSLRREALMALVFATAMLVSTFTYTKAGAETEIANTDANNTFTLMQFNARFDNAEPELLISVLDEFKPDIITLQEVTPRIGEWLEKNRETYGYQHICETDRIVGGAAILSKFRWATGTIPVCRENGSLAFATLNLAGLPLDVVAIHLHWPWPFRQPAQIRRLSPLLKTLGRSALIAGDFNATPWSAAMQQIASDSGASIVPSAPTWLTPALPKPLRPIAGLPIDHILIKGVAALGSPLRLRDAGSDHLPVLLQFRISPQPEN